MEEASQKVTNSIIRVTTFKMVHPLGTMNVCEKNSIIVFEMVQFGFRKCLKQSS